MPRSIIEQSKGATSTVVGFDAFCANTLFQLAHGIPHIRFVGIGYDENRTAGSGSGNERKSDICRGQGPERSERCECQHQFVVVSCGVGGPILSCQTFTAVRALPRVGHPHLVIGERFDFDRVSLRYHAPDQFAPHYAAWAEAISCMTSQDCSTRQATWLPIHRSLRRRNRSALTPSNTRAMLAPPQSFSAST